MPVRLTAVLAASLIALSPAAWAQGGGGGGSGGGGSSADGGTAGSGSPGGSGSLGVTGSTTSAPANAVTRENGVNDNKAVPSPSTTNTSSSPPSYGQSPAGAAATKSLSSTNTGTLRIHCRQQASDIDRRDIRVAVRDRIRKDDPVAVTHGAAGIDHVRDITFAFGWCRPEQRLAKTA
jgi:hypothetical protein